MAWRGFVRCSSFPSQPFQRKFRAVQCHVGGHFREPRLSQAMRTALDRLLVRPSTLRALRSLIAQEELSFAVLQQPPCRLPRPTACTAPRQAQSTFSTFCRTCSEKHQNAEDAVSKADSSQSGTTLDFDAKLPKFRAATPLDEWIEALHFQQRVYGKDGVRAIWRELKNCNVDLPTDGQKAQLFWEILLANDDILKKVVAYAEGLKGRTGSFYGPLYETIIRRCFSESRHSDVHRWHDKLFVTFPPQPGAVRRIAPKVGGGRAATKAFRYIYHRCGQRDVYDALIPSLCHKGHWYAALKHHPGLVNNGDLPAGTSPNSLMELDFQTALLKAQRNQTLQYNSRSEPGQPRKVEFSRESMNRVLGEVHGIQPKKMDDHFCARIFATKAFSIDVVIRGLGMFGIEEVGPLALREMACRTPDAQKISHNLSVLHEAGISVGKSVYSQALQKFAEDGRQDLVNSLISTDQHPDAFEDSQLQHQLLSTFVERGQWNDVHRTLAILTVFHQDPVKEQWNILVQKLSRLRDLNMLCKVLEDTQARGISLTEASLSALQAHQLRLRESGHAPVAKDIGYDDTTLIANIWRNTLESGQYVEPRRWTEIFRRYGMTERFDEVVKLALWLADWFNPQIAANRPDAPLQRLLRHQHYGSLSIVALAVPPTHPGHPLHQIFRSEQLRAFISWGVRRAYVLPGPADPAESEKPPHYWAQGLRLCKALRDRGVYVSTTDVRVELRRQLVHLFGRGESNRAHNRRSARNNPYTVLEMIEYANQLWSEATGVPLLDPRELVSGNGSRVGVWWARSLRWDVLQQVHLALGAGNVPGLPLDDDVGAMQELEADVFDDGWGPPAFAATDGADEPAAPTRANDGSDHDLGSDRHMNKDRVTEERSFGEVDEAASPRTPDRKAEVKLDRAIS